MRNPALLVLVLLACIVTACTPASDVLPPSPPRALDVSNVGGEAWLSPEEFESSESLKTRWAPPWDVWANGDYIMYTPYSTVMGRPAYIDFFMWGDNWNRNIGGQVPLVYGQAYILNAKTKKWSQFSLDGKYSSKYSGFIELEKTNFDYTYTYYDEDGNEQTATKFDAYFNAPITMITPEKFSEGDNYVATYICSAMAEVNYRNYKYTYACGCIDDNIESCGRWNIQRLTVNPAPTCGNNRCEQGEDPWSCTQDCLDGPNAPVALADEEAEGSEFCILGNTDYISCTMDASNNGVSITITNTGTPVQFNDLVVKQWDDAVDCAFTTITVETNSTVTAKATCYPPITSTGTTDFGIEGFMAFSDGSGSELWGYARVNVDNYRTNAPEDKDAVLVEFYSNTNEILLSTWIGEGETIVATLNGKEIETTIQAIDVNGRVSMILNGIQNDMPLKEEQGFSINDEFIARLKDVIVREGVQQPPNSVNLALFEGTNYIGGTLLEVGETRTYAIDGKNITAEVIQVAGRRASVRVNGDGYDNTGIYEEGGYAYFSGGNSLRVFSIYYQGTPDQCPQEANSCNGNVATWSGCFDFGEYGFNTMNWPMQIGSVTTCDEICSNGYCRLDGTEGYQYEGDTYIYTLNGVEYEVTLLYVTEDETAARFMVNGEVTELLEEGNSDTVAGVRLEILNIYSPSYYGRAVSFVLREPTEETELTTCSNVDQGFRFGSRNMQFIDVVASENVVILNDIETGTEVQFTYDTNGEGEATLGGIYYPFALTSLGSTDYELCFGSNVVKIFELQQDVVDLDEGETALVSDMSSNYYEVTVLFVSDDSTTAKLLIEGETTDSLAEGDSENAGGLAISVVDITGKTVKFLTDDDPTDYIELSTIGGMKVGGEIIEDVDVVFKDATSARYFSLTLSADALQGPDTFMKQGQNFRDQIDEPQGLLGNINIIVDDITKEVVYGRVIGLGDAEFSLSNGVAITSDVGSISLGNENLEVLSGSALLGENNNDETGLFLFFNDGDAVLRYTYTLTEESIGDVITLAGVEYKIVNVVDSTLKLQQIGTIVTPAVQVSSLPPEPILIAGGGSGGTGTAQ